MFCWKILVPCHHTLYFMFSKKYWSHIHDFQELIKRIGGFVGARLFVFVPTCSISKMLRFITTNIFQACIGIFLIFLLRHPGLSKNKNKWFLGWGTRPKIPKSKKCGLWGSPISKSKSYKTKIDQNNSPELLSIYFP